MRSVQMCPQQHRGIPTSCTGCSEVSWSVHGVACWLWEVEKHLGVQQWHGFWSVMGNDLMDAVPLNLLHNLTVAHGRQEDFNSVVRM